MSGIECINLLAFIQFITVVDFGLYYLDDWEINWLESIINTKKNCRCQHKQYWFVPRIY